MGGERACNARRVHIDIEILIVTKNTFPFVHVLANIQWDIRALVSHACCVDKRDGSTTLASVHHFSRTSHLTDTKKVSLASAKAFTSFRHHSLLSKVGSADEVGR